MCRHLGVGICFFGGIVMKKIVSIAALVLAPAVAIAAEEPAKLWKGEANLGYIYNSGNTNSENLHFRSKATRDGEQWRNIYRLEAVNETSEEIRTAENYFGSAKAEYKIGERSYLFGLLEYTKDRFSGFDYEAAATLGYGQDIIRNEVHELSADIGVGYRVTELETNGDVEEDAIVRVGALYLWNINENTIFDEDFSYEIGEQRKITKSLTRLRMKINGSLSASIAYEIKHTSDVPPGTKNSDRTTLLGLAYTF